MRKLGLAGAVLVAVVTAGCTGSADDERSAPTPAPSPTSSPSAAEPDPTEAVREVSLRSADVPEGTVIELVPGGDQVAGQVTLDECGYPFTSEGSRVARRQVSVGYPDDSGSYSNEVVAYDTAANAELALREWRSAVQDCPDDEFRDSAVEGIPPVRAKLLEFHTLASLPVPNNSVARQVVTTRAGRSLYLSVVYMQHGDVLDANYLSTQAEPTRAQVARLTRQAVKTGARLMGLPGGTVA